MLSDARCVDGLGAGELTDPLDHLLGRQESIGRRGVSERELAAQTLEVGPPLAGVGTARVGVRAERRIQIDENLAQITHDRNVSGTDLGDLGGVDVNVDDLRVRREVRCLAGDPVIEPGTERHDEVGLLQRQHSGDRAVHAGHAEVLLVRVGERTPGHERGDNRRAGSLCQGEQLLRSAGADDATADVEHRLLGLRDQLSRSLDLLPVGFGHRPVPRQIDLRRPDERRLGLLGILRDVHQHGTGATRRGDLVGSRDRAGDVFGTLDQEGVLRDRHRDPHDVGFLERISAHEAREDLARDAQQRHGVHVGIRDRRDEVRGPRPRRRDGNTDLARCRRVPFGCVTGTLLVSDEDVTNCLVVHEWVVDGHDRAAGKAEDIGHSQEVERTDDRLSARHHRRRGAASGGPGHGRGDVGRHDDSLRWMSRVAREERLVRRRAFGCRTHESRVLGEDATGIARRKRLPALPAGTQLSLVDE